MSNEFLYLGLCALIFMGSHGSLMIETSIKQSSASFCSRESKLVSVMSNLRNKKVSDLLRLRGGEVTLPGGVHLHIPGTQTEIPENLTESLSKLEINPGFALGLDIFAGVELCKESLDAFNRQIDVADLFLFLSTPISLLSAQNVEYRKTACVCLTKLCRAKGNAKILQEYLKSAGMDLDFIAVPLRMSLDSSDLHFKEQALKALSYLTDDTGADFIRRHSFAADMVRCVCVPDGAEGVAEEALACLTRTRRGLGEVFSGAALEQLEAALTAPEDNTALAAAGLVVRLSAESPEILK